MIIKLEKEITGLTKEKIKEKLNEFGYKSNFVSTQYNNYIIGVGNKEFDIRAIGVIEGVKDIYTVVEPSKLVSRQWKTRGTIIDLGDGVKIGHGNFQIMAGPCSIESEEQIKTTINHLIKNNIKIMRGGVYKPRSSPYAFRGLGMEGLKIFYKYANENNIKIITEVMMPEQIEEMYQFVDIFQVGARNSQNFNLLDALGKQDKPVMLKRGISGTLDELLASAEYIFSNGNEDILLCERGIRTYEKSYRNTFDINAIPYLKEKSHLPVVVDASHGVGIRRLVEPVTLAGIIAGGDSVITEVHETPQIAFSDGAQTLSHAEAEIYYKNIRKTVDFRKTLEKF